MLSFVKLSHTLQVSVMNGELWTASSSRAVLSLRKKNAINYGLGALCIEGKVRRNEPVMQGLFGFVSDQSCV